VTLEGTVDGNNVSIGNRRIPEMICPPTAKSSIRINIETLFRSTGFTKRIGSVCTIDNKILRSSHTVKDACTCVL
jgi:hypothetical protein